MRLVLGLLGLLALAVRRGPPPQSRAATGRGSATTRSARRAARPRPGSPRRTCAGLRRQRVGLDGTVDSSPIYLAASRSPDARTTLLRHDHLRQDRGDRRDERARALALHAAGYSSWAGSARITNATPLADPSRKFVYAVSPDGKIDKLSVVERPRDGGWPRAITRDSTREKIAPPLNYSQRAASSPRPVATSATRRRTRGTSSSIDAATRPHPPCLELAVLRPHRPDHASSCAESDSAIWGRGGVVVVPATGDLLVATGNAKFERPHGLGRQRPDAVAGRVAPAAELDADQSGDAERDRRRSRHDRPAVLSRLAVQGGKDGKLRLLSLTRMNGKGGHSAKTGGELQTLPLRAGTVHRACGLEGLGLLRDVLGHAGVPPRREPAGARRGRTARRARARSSPAACSTSTTRTAG